MFASKEWVIDLLNKCFKKNPSTETYSTEEQVIGTWIDGKPIYKKTYCPVNSNTIDSNFPQSAYTLVRAEGSLLFTTGNQLAVPASNITIYQNGSYKSLIVETISGTIKSSDKNSITVYYTKVADTATS